jgi:uncharacterized membrane protein
LLATIVDASDSLCENKLLFSIIQLTLARSSTMEFLVDTQLPVGTRLLKTRAFWLGVTVVLCVAWQRWARAVFVDLPSRIPVHFGAEGVSWDTPAMATWLLLPRIAVTFFVLSVIIGQFAAAHPGIINGLPAEWRSDLPANDRAVLQRYIKLVSAQIGCILAVGLLLAHVAVWFAVRNASFSAAESYSMPTLSVLGLGLALAGMIVAPMLTASAQFPSRAREFRHARPE